MTGPKKKGQATAELALLLPLLLLILLGALDLGRAFSVWLTLSNGTREGARYATMYPLMTDRIITQTRADLIEQGLSPAALQIEVLPADSNQRTGGRPVTVTARYSLPLVTTYLFGSQPVVMSAQTGMVVMKGGS